jgi:hypothetical protein
VKRRLLNFWPSLPTKSTWIAGAFQCPPNLGHEALRATLTVFHLLEKTLTEGDDEDHCDAAKSVASLMAGADGRESGSV